MTRRKGSGAKYPIGQRIASGLKSKGGIRYEDIRLESLRQGRLKADDLSISADTLLMQAQVSEGAGYMQLGSNLRRAAELVKIPNSRLLEIYEALRPRHSTFEELSEISNELLKKYGAPKNARFVRDAASAYRDAGLLRPNRRSQPNSKPRRAR
jgi:propanediol dehydratase small subunit